MSTQTKSAAHYFDNTELVNTDNIAAATYYYPSSSGQTMDHYKDLSLEFVVSGGVTLTVEGMTDDDDVSGDWIDITKAGYNLKDNSVGNASFVDVSGLLDFDNVNVRKYRVKVVTSDGSNHVQVHARRKAL